MKTKALAAGVAVLLVASGAAYATWHFTLRDFGHEKLTMRLATACPWD